MVKPLDKQHRQRARNHLAEKGIEMTPDEVDSERKAAYATIRQELRKRGFTVPDSDEELFLMMHEAYKHRPALGEHEP
jgi:hypothetical protein